MKMSESLPQLDLNLTGSQESTLSREGSRAKTLALLESKQAWARGREADSGPKSSDLLASYDLNTSSWRTSQLCFVALLSGQEDGLAEFSATWPSAGMMRNGKTYRRQPWALPIAESVSGLLPTPTATDWKRSPQKASYSMRPVTHNCADDLAKWTVRESGLSHARLVPYLWLWVMGFPNG